MAPTATLTILAGQVEVASGSDPFEPGTDGATLEVGATIRTGVEGRAELRWFDGSITRLDFGTTFRIVEMESSGGRTVIVGEHTQGRTYSRVIAFTESGSRFDVATPSATASVQGTEYATIIEGDGSTTIAVFEDAVIVDSRVGEATVAAGFTINVGPPEILVRLPDPEPTPDDLLNSDWIQFNQNR